MDQATQQNAALVEEMAAAASSLRVQSSDLVQAVAIFKLDGNVDWSASPSAPDTVKYIAKPVARPALGSAKHSAAVRPQLATASKKMSAASPAVPKLAHSAEEGSWESF